MRGQQQIPKESQQRIKKTRMSPIAKDKSEKIEKDKTGQHNYDNVKKIWECIVFLHMWLSLLPPVNAVGFQDTSEKGGGDFWPDTVRVVMASLCSSVCVWILYRAALFVMKSPESKQRTKNKTIGQRRSASSLTVQRRQIKESPDLSKSQAEEEENGRLLRESVCVWFKETMNSRARNNTLT